MLGVSFRKALLILLFVWTFVFFLFIGLIPNIFDTIIPPANCREGGGLQSKQNPFPKELSFIVLNWKRLDCIKTIVQHAQVYHQFITEIVVGNNNPNITLKSQDFFSPHIKVRVLNFPQNRYFYARYEACLLAEGKYCYLQDDDWDNKHLRSLYANFLRYPHLLHTDTNAFVHYLSSWEWTFFDPDIDLHTGFSWVGTGAITSKESVRRFTEEQAILLSREDLSLADMYFSTWFNQVPYQLENELSELESRFGFSSEPGGILRNKLHITKGVQILFDHLHKNTSYFTKVENHPMVEERYTKSPCYGDDCLFMTSMSSFPNPRQFIYQKKMDLEMVEQIHKTAFNHQNFVANPYHYAVDENLDTAWISAAEVQLGDFFGIDLLQPSEKEYIYLKVGHSFQAEFSVEVSDDGYKWDNETCEWEVSNKFAGATYYHRYYLTSGCACSFRFIRFRALEDYNSQLQIYDISFADRQAVWESGISRMLLEDQAACEKQGDEILLAESTPTTFLREIGNGELPVTLILLNWKRTRNFPSIFKHLAQYPFVNEYIIWNNNNEMMLEESQLFPDGPPKNVSVRLINSPQNLHDYAKYLSCSMASNDYCYFQDDDWLNVHFKSQYSNFLRFPHLFHSMTIPIIYLEHRRWNIYDEALGLHAGFSWLGVGSFTEKKRVQHFLRQLSEFNLNQEELLQADIFFSYLNNDFPVELSATASALDQSDAWSTSVDQWAIVYKRLGLSSSRVYNHLKQGNVGGLISTQTPTPPYEQRDVRSPCHDDNCLFITNAYPFPYPSKVPFDPYKSIKDQETLYNALDWPSNWFWNDNSFDRAVDGNPFTAWSSYQVGKEGDYFGLDLLHNKPHQKFTVVLSHDIAKYSVAVSTAATCCAWTHVNYEIAQAWVLAGPMRTYTILLEYDKPFRFINLFLQQSTEEIMSVYEITEGDYPGDIISFSENKVQNPSFEDSLSFAFELEPNMWFVQHPVQVDVEGQQRANTVAAVGTRSLVFSSKGGAASVYEARQAIDLQQNSPRLVVVSAHSKAENVVNMEYPGAGYALTVDLTFMDGNTEHNAYTSIFNPGSHTWQAKTITINSEKSIKTVTIHLMFRNHKGTVYFDDISLHEAL